jgi:hypothetical protein
MDRYAVIVDGYHLRDGDDRGFASAFRRRGVRPVTVMSTPQPLPKFVKKSTWYPEDFDAVHFHDGDFQRTLERSRGTTCSASSPATSGASSSPRRSSRR